MTTTDGNIDINLNGSNNSPISFWFRVNKFILRLCSAHQFKNLQVRKTNLLLGWTEHFGGNFGVGPLTSIQYWNYFFEIYNILIPTPPPLKRWKGYYQQRHSLVSRCFGQSISMVWTEVGRTSFRQSMGFLLLQGWSRLNIVEVSM